MSRNGNADDMRGSKVPENADGNIYLHVWSVLCMSSNMPDHSLWCVHKINKQPFYELESVCIFHFRNSSHYDYKL